MNRQTSVCFIKGLNEDTPVQFKFTLQNGEVLYGELYHRDGSTDKRFKEYKVDVHVGGQHLCSVSEDVNIAYMLAFVESRYRELQQILWDAEDLEASGKLRPDYRKFVPNQTR